MDRRDLATTLLTAFAIALVLIAGSVTTWGPASSVAPSTSEFRILNLTSSLGPTFERGAPQAFGVNSSTVLVTGVVGDPANSTIPFPLLGTFGTPATGAPVNLSPDIADLFHGGDTLGLAWNGTSWLISGEAAWGSDVGGAAALWSDGRWTNLTPLVRPYFSGNGGIWFVGWNGTSWLLGGQSPAGAALVGLHGESIVSYSGLIPNNRADHWIQFLEWNGSAWLAAGQGTFGVLRGGRYLDLSPQSRFAGGVFAADWNGSSWLVGGGSSGAVEYLRGTQLTPGPTLPSSFSRWVNSITWDGRGWYVGGEGSGEGSGYDPELVYLDSTSSSVVDLTELLPGSFAGGQIQFAALAPFGGTSTVLLLGQGGLDPSATSTGPSVGAAAAVTRA